MRAGINHIFIQSEPFVTNKLYSFDKITEEVILISGNVQEIGMLDEKRETLYFFEASSDLLFSTNGTTDEVIEYEIPGNLGYSAEVTGVLTFGDITVINFDENSNDFWTLLIEDGQITPLPDLTDISNFSSETMAFFKIGNSLIFSFKDLNI